MPYKEHLKTRVGMLTVTIEVSAGDGQENESKEQFDFFSKFIKGTGSNKDVQMWAALLNGAGVDKRLNRPKPRPCGCKGKE
jgi:hypothetical protein